MDVPLLQRVPGQQAQQEIRNQVFHKTVWMFEGPLLSVQHG